MICSFNDPARHTILCSLLKFFFLYLILFLVFEQNAEYYIIFSWSLYEGNILQLDSQD